MSLLLTNYCVDNVSDLLFTVTFSIPDNCLYSVATVGKTHNITIQLKPTFTKPSKAFVINTLSLTADAGDCELNVQFIQIYGGTSIRPNIKVTNC